MFLSKARQCSVRFETRKGTLVPRNTGVVSTEVCFPTISKAPQNGVLELVSPFRPKRGHWKGPRPLKGDTTCEDSESSQVVSPFRGRGPFQCPLLGLKGDTSSRTPFWGALDMVGKHTSVETTPVFRGTSVPFLVSNRTLEEKAIVDPRRISCCTSEHSNRQSRVEPGNSASPALEEDQILCV